MGFETGIQYSNKGYENKGVLFFEDVIIYPPLIAHLYHKLVYNFHYLDVPLMANFSFGKRKIRFISSAGITTNFLIKQKAKSISDDGNSSSFASSMAFNTINFSPTISFGIDYKINEALNLRVSPTFRYGVSKIIDASITDYLWNTGINVGFYL